MRPETNGVDLKNGRRRDAQAVQKLPPHNPEAEQGVLGCILESPLDCIPICIEKLRDGVESFYDLRHQEIYGTMLELYEDRDAIDVITLQARLKLWNKLEQVGGIAYLSALPDVIPSTAALESYIAIVREKHTLRKMISACSEVVSRIYDFEGDVDTLMDQCERDVLRISEARVQVNALTVQDYVRLAITEIEQAHQRGPGVLDGLSTGFTDLDRMTSGLHNGEMIVIAARPSLGKTSLAMNIAEHVAINLRLPVGIFSLEMTGTSLIKRMLASRSRVNLRNVNEGFLSERDMPRLTNAAGQVHNAPLYLDDTSGQSVLQVRAKARRWWQQYGIRLFIIDYLQLMNALGGKRKVDSRQQEIADISSGIKNLAKELNVPVIVLSQLNRDVERDKNRKPRMSDLRESGAIEQDADVVGFLYKVATGNDDDSADNYTDAQAINLAIAKNRNGPADQDVNLTFLKQFTRFETAARVDDNDVPGPQREFDETRHADP